MHAVYFFSAFKIDLIVWKLHSAVRNTNNDNRFKIDLIVWKSFKQSAYSIFADKFKIDLIVWKWQ